MYNLYIKQLARPTSMILVSSNCRNRLNDKTKVPRMVERRGVCRVLAGNPAGKRPLGRPRRRWEDNIKMDLQKVECEAWTRSTCLGIRSRWWALVNVVMNLWVP